MALGEIFVELKSIDIGIIGGFDEWKLGYRLASKIHDSSQCFLDNDYFVRKLYLIGRDDEKVMEKVRVKAGQLEGPSTSFAEPVPFNSRDLEEIADSLHITIIAADANEGQRSRDMELYDLAPENIEKLAKRYGPAFRNSHGIKIVATNPTDLMVSAFAQYAGCQYHDELSTWIGLNQTDTVRFRTELKRYMKKLSPEELKKALGVEEVIDFDIRAFAIGPHHDPLCIFNGIMVNGLPFPTNEFIGENNEMRKLATDMWAIVIGSAKNSYDATGQWDTMQETCTATMDTIEAVLDQESIVTASAFYTQSPEVLGGKGTHTGELVRIRDFRSCVAEDLIRTIATQENEDYFRQSLERQIERARRFARQGVRDLVDYSERQGGFKKIRIGTIKVRGNGGKSRTVKDDDTPEPSPPPETIGLYSRNNNAPSALRHTRITISEEKGVKSKCIDDYIGFEGADKNHTIVNVKRSGNSVYILEEEYNKYDGTNNYKLFRLNPKDSRKSLIGEILKANITDFALDRDNVYFTDSSTDTNVALRVFSLGSWGETEQYYGAEKAYNSVITFPVNGDDSHIGIVASSTDGICSWKKGKHGDTSNLPVSNATALNFVKFNGQGLLAFGTGDKGYIAKAEYRIRLAEKAEIPALEGVVSMHASGDSLDIYAVIPGKQNSGKQNKQKTLARYVFENPEDIFCQKPKPKCTTALLGESNRLKAIVPLERHILVFKENGFQIYEMDTLQHRATCRDKTTNKEIFTTY